jgi:hypothetical protein
MAADLHAIDLLAAVGLIDHPAREPQDLADQLLPVVDAAPLHEPFLRPYRQNSPIDLRSLCYFHYRQAIGWHFL